MAHNIMNFLDRIFLRIFRDPPQLEHWRSCSDPICKLDSCEPPTGAAVLIAMATIGFAVTWLATTEARVRVPVLAFVIAFSPSPSSRCLHTLFQMTSIATDATLVVAHPACRLLMATPATACARSHHSVDVHRRGLCRDRIHCGAQILFVHACTLHHPGLWRTQPQVLLKVLFLDFLKACQREPASQVHRHQVM